MKLNAEDIDDIRTYDDAVKLQDELLPTEMVRRLVDGEQPIRVWREYRGMSQANLAGGAGISPAYLSQLENRLRKGSTQVLLSLARVLDVDIEDLSFEKIYRMKVTIVKPVK